MINTITVFLIIGITEALRNRVIISGSTTSPSFHRFEGKSSTFCMGINPPIIIQDDGLINTGYPQYSAENVLVKSDPDDCSGPVWLSISFQTNVGFVLKYNDPVTFIGIKIKPCSGHPSTLNNR